MDERAVPMKTKLEKSRYPCMPMSDAEPAPDENHGPTLASLLMALFAIGLIFLPAACGLSFVTGAPHALLGPF